MTLGAWCWRDGGWALALAVVPCVALGLWCMWFLATSPEQAWVAVLASLWVVSDLWEEMPE